MKCVRMGVVLAVLCMCAVSHADVTQDANGWTVVTPSADSRIVYVSDSTGDDANDGLSVMTAKKTIQAGKSLMRNGFPDHLLLKRGDVFSNQRFHNWSSLSGRSSTEPMLLGTYGNGPRPVVKPPHDDPGIYMSSGCSYLAIIGIHFYPESRDPDSPAFVDSAPAAGIRYKDLSRYNQQWFLVEDVCIESCATGVVVEVRGHGTTTGLAGFQLRRSVVIDSYAVGGHSQGMFVRGVDGILIEENVFDHNGWYGDRTTGGSVGARATTFNHNIYMDNENPWESSNTQDQRQSVIVRNNIFSRASASGIQMRPGGTLENNLGIRNADFKAGGGSQGNGAIDPATPDGADATVRLNVILETTDIGDSDPLGRGLTLQNIRTATVCQNIIAHEIASPVNTYGVIAGRSNNPQPAIEFDRNTIYEYYRGAIHNTHDAVIDPEENNNYWDAASVPWPVTGTNRNSEDVEFVDPNRSVASYNATLGGAATFEAFIAEARKQSKENWRPEYTASAVNDYIRAGFAESSQPPPGPEPIVIPIPAGATQVKIEFE